MIEQYEPHALNDHLANGRPWDLDRTHGGLQILPPFQGRGDDDALAAGNADALVLNRARDRRVRPRRRDHDERRPRVPARPARRARHASPARRHAHGRHHRPARRRGSARASRGSPWTAQRITAFDYKPEEPTGDRVCTEVFCFDGPALLERLERMAGDDRRTVRRRLRGRVAAPSSSPTRTPWSSSTSSTATGAMSAPSVRTTAHTWSCSATMRRCRSTIRRGRSSPGP